MTAQRITSENYEDADGNPHGGFAEAMGVRVDWQTGPLVDAEGNRKEPTGAFVETVLEVALQRMRYYQESKFACRENALTITKIEEALHWLQHRTAVRASKGIEGTHEIG